MEEKREGREEEEWVAEWGGKGWGGQPVAYKKAPVLLPEGTVVGFATLPLFG